MKTYIIKNPSGILECLGNFRLGEDHLLDEFHPPSMSLWSDDGPGLTQVTSAPHRQSILGNADVVGIVVRREAIIPGNLIPP